LTQRRPLIRTDATQHTLRHVDSLSRYVKLSLIGDGVGAAPDSNRRSAVVAGYSSSHDHGGGGGGGSPRVVWRQPFRWLVPAPSARWSVLLRARAHDGLFLGSGDERLGDSEVGRAFSVAREYSRRAAAAPRELVSPLTRRAYE
jgi:hypothetical protein